MIEQISQRLVTELVVANLKHSVTVLRNDDVGDWISLVGVATPMQPGLCQIPDLQAC